MAEKKDNYKSSFGIIRANPRISGNLKISVDSSGNIWLNSIDSNEEMSRNLYKGYRTSPDNNFSQDVYSFFNFGRTPLNFIFGTKNEDRVRETPTKNLEDQYDGFYHSGVSPLISDTYSEDFSYLAPLWLGEIIPKYFVIFRIDDPIDFSYQIQVSSLEGGKYYKVLEDPEVDKNSPSYLEYKIRTGINSVEYTSGQIFLADIPSFEEIQGFGKVILLDANYNNDLIGNIEEHFKKNILPKSSIVKTFSLDEKSQIGKYLRKIKKSPGYTQSLIDIKFEENSLSLYNGVSIKDGVYSKKGEYLNNLFTNDSTIIEFEEYITDGFRRNGVISYNLLNLEFLFDDPEADLYSINRYYGLYVDNIPTGTFQLSGDLFYEESQRKGNFPEPKLNQQISNSMISPFFQTNNEGLKIFIDKKSQWGYIPSSDDIHINERNKIFYVKDKNDNFYSFKGMKDYGTPGSDFWGEGTRQDNLIILKNRTLDLSLLSGINPSKTKEYKAELTDRAGKSYMVIRIDGELTPGDSIILYHPFGINIKDNKRYDYFVASDLTYVIGDWGPGSYTEEGGSYYFHPFGTNAEICKAIADALNSVNYKTYQCFNIENEIIIITDGADSKIDNLFSIYAYSDYYNETPYIEKNKIYFNDIDASIVTLDLKFTGGSKYKNSRVKIKKEDANKIKKGISYIRTQSGLSKVRHVGKFIDKISSDTEFNSLEDYKTHAIVEINDPTFKISLGTSKTIIVDELVENEVGLFSIYPIKDLDIDFWSSTYGKTPTDEYYRYIDIQPEGPIYDGIDYAVAKGALILYDGVTYGPDVNFIFRGKSGVKTYILNKSSDSQRQNVVPLLYVKDLEEALNGINEPLDDLDKFPGFSGIQEIKFLSDSTSVVTKKDQLFFGKADNEYDVLKENYLRNLVFKSRVVPYICKWVYDGGTDVRNNPYRLNSNHAFTPLNFSPSFFSPGRSPQYFTNEWYLLEKPPIGATVNLLKNNPGYCFDLIDINKLKDANPSLRDYFTDYFSIDGKDFYELLGSDYEEVNKKSLEEVYTYFKYNSSSGFSETLFRGVLVKIKERTESSIKTKERDKFKINDPKFNNYKFSCILKSIEDPDPYKNTSPISFEIHWNENYRTITLIITVIINDARFIDPVKFREEVYPEFSQGDTLPSSSTGSWYFNPTGIYVTSDYFGLYSISDKIRHFITDDNASDISESGRLSNGGNAPNPVDPLNFPEYITNTLASSKKYYGDVKLSTSLNVTTRSGLSSDGIEANVGSTGGIIPIYINTNYDTDLREEVKFYDAESEQPATPGVGDVFDIGNKFTLFAPKINDTFSESKYFAPWPTGSGKNFLNFKSILFTQNSGNLYYFDFSNLGILPILNPGVPIPLSDPLFPPSAVYQKGAGQNYWDFVFNKLSFPEIYKLFYDDSPFIKYTKSYWDPVSSTTVYENDTFSLELVKPSSFIQRSRKIPEEDDFKPEYLSNFLAGYKLSNEFSQTEYFRYGGGYSPKFRDVMTFENVKSDILSVDIDTNTNRLDLEISIRIKDPEISEYYGIGSIYEILINDTPRKKLRLIRGCKYRFNFIGFTSSNNPPSPPGVIRDFIISNLQNSGDSDSKYSIGFVYDTNSEYAEFEVPLNAPDILYYEFLGENFAGGTILVKDGLEYKNTSLGLSKESFGKIKNVNYYKYSKIYPFNINPDSGYKLEYPLIDETPIGKKDMFVFESTWDPGRYHEYISSGEYLEVPGTKNMIEQKSFFGSKCMRLPKTIKEAKQIKYESSISGVFQINKDLYPRYEILWEETSTEIRALLLLDRVLIRNFKSGGISKIFDKFLVSEFGFGSETSLSDDIEEYINSNIISQYEAKLINVFIKKSPIVEGQDILKPIVSDLEDYQKISQGFLKSNNNDITKINDLSYEFKLVKDPSFDYSVSFSFFIGKI
jgi:hypothetical protein